MNTNRKATKIFLWLGISLFPLFGLLDLAVYPAFLEELFTIRALVVVFYFINLAFLPRIKDEHLFITTFIILVLSSFSLSLMCFITGDGFASPYYAGQFIVIIASTILFPLRQNYYAAIIAGCMVQHFTLLSFLPWKISALAENVFFLGACVFCGWYGRRFIRKLISEIRTLQGIIPICANCKKIRNDKGYWDQVEYYISKHSEAKFSHGICPDCEKELYGDTLGDD